MASQNIKGITIQIGGDTTELQKALKAPEQQAAALQKELRQIDNALKFNPGSMELLAQKAQVTQREITALNEKLRLLREAAQNATPESVGDEAYRALQREIITTESKLSALEKTASDTDKKLNSIDAGGLNSVGKASDQAEKKMSGLGREINSTENKVDELGKGFDKSGKASKKLDDETEDLSKSLKEDLNPAADDSAISMAAMGAAATALAAAAAKAVKALVDVAISSARIADDIATNATIMGITTQKYQEFAYMADFVDTSVETIGQSMRRLTSNMANAQRGTGTAIEAFNRLGVSFTTSSGSLRDSELVFADAIDSLGRIGSEADRDAIAMQLFGRSAQDLNPLIAAGGDRMRELADEANRLGYVLNETDLNKLNEMNDAFDRLGKAWEAFKNAIAVSIAPFLTDLLNGFTYLLTGVDVTAKETLNDVKTEAKEAGAAMSDSFSDTADSVVASMGKVSDEIFETYEDARKAADDYNKQFEKNAYVLIQNSKGRAQVIRKNEQDLYKSIQVIVDTYYSHLDEAQKIHQAKYLYSHRELLELLGRDYSGAGLKDGESMANGIALGIQSKVPAVVEAARRMAAAADQTVRKEMGINSPSKVMRSYGKYTVDGFVNGIKEGTQAVQRAMSSVMGSAQRELEAGVWGIGGGSNTTTTYSNSFDNSRLEVHQPITVQIDPRNVQDFYNVIDYFNNDQRKARAVGRQPVFI